MLSKISLRNVKRSSKNYIIYFMTLSFSICLFYGFNSIEAQKTMLIINKSQHSTMRMISDVMKYVSSFVTIILAFLIIYANYFLMKRRKKEFAIYFLLGIERRKISNIVIVETVIIGIISLVAGLLMGVFLSHFLSIFTAKMFVVNLREFHFIFSPEAFLRTIFYFGFIFVVVVIFNLLSVMRLKLIDLFTDSRKNELLKVKNVKSGVVVFFVSMIFLAIAYILININGFKTLDIVFIGSILFGTFGTLMFFIGASVIFMYKASSNKKFYFKKLNIFVLRQINSKINTNIISVTIICLMLLISIGTLGTGLGMATVMDKNLKKIIPFDASLYGYEYDGDGSSESISRLYDDIEQEFPNIDSIIKEYCFMRYYSSDIFYKDIIDFRLESVTDEVYDNYKLTVIPISDFNRVMRINGKDEIHLNENQFAINYNNPGVEEYYKNFLKNDGTLNLSGVQLTSSPDELYNESLYTDMIGFEIGSLIVDDKFVENLDMENLFLNFKYLDGDNEEEFYKIADSIIKSSPVFKNFFTKEMVINNNIGIKTIVSYLAIYIGILFLVISTVVLALQQLSESTDNIERYRLLGKLGADRKLLNRALFDQIAIYFFLPLFLAIVHSIVGLNVSYKIVRQFGKIDIGFTSILILIMFVIFYGGYFFATYICSKNIIGERN